MRYYLSLLLSMCFCFSWAQPEEARLQTYAQKIGTVQTLQSDFVEEKHLSLLDKPIQSRGTLTFDKSAEKLRWQYQQPFVNGFLIEKDNVYRLQGAGKKPVKQAAGRMFLAEMVVWLTLDFEALKKNYAITLHDTEITFLPLAKEHKVVKEITVWLDKKDPRVVTQVKMEEPSGDFIVWKFSNTQLNPIRPDEVF